MLKLMRKSGEQILIGDDIVIHFHRFNRERGQVSVGIEAPKEVLILRGELAEGYVHNKGNKE